MTVDDNTIDWAGRTMASTFSRTPPRGINIPQWVVHTVGVAVEPLRAHRVLHEAVGREERRHHGVVHPAVHVDEYKVVEVFVAREAAVEHRSAREVAAPSLGVAKVAPCVVTQPLLRIAVLVGDGGPAPEVVLQDVIELGVPVFPLRHGEHAVGARQEGVAVFHGRVPVVLRHKLAVPHIALGAQRVVKVLLHEDALSVVAVRIAEAVSTLLDLVHLVEACIGDGLGRGGEDAIRGLGLG